MWRSGSRISSADCGMTSNPTKRNGTATRTPSIPATPPVNHGSAVAALPPAAMPVSITNATPTRKATATVWATAAGRIPM